MNDLDEVDWADWLRVMTVPCVTNTRLEDIHAGQAPVIETGDFSDVIAVDADGRRLAWPEVSHFGNETMKELMCVEGANPRGRADRSALERAPGETRTDPAGLRRYGSAVAA